MVTLMVTRISTWIKSPSVRDEIFTRHSSMKKCPPTVQFADIPEEEEVSHETSLGEWDMHGEIGKVLSKLDELLEKVSARNSRPALRTTSLQRNGTITRQPPRGLNLLINDSNEK